MSVNKHFPTHFPDFGWDDKIKNINLGNRKKSKYWNKQGKFFRFSCQKVFHHARKAEKWQQKSPLHSGKLRAWGGGMAREENGNFIYQPAFIILKTCGQHREMMSNRIFLIRYCTKSCSLQLSIVVIATRPHNAYVLCAKFSLTLWLETQRVKCSR